jgi:hypothetical protein
MTRSVPRLRWRMAGASKSINPASDKRSADGGSTDPRELFCSAQHRQRAGWRAGDRLHRKKGPFLALSQERNRVRLPSQINSLGRFYWLEGPGMSASRPPTRGRQGICDPAQQLQLRLGHASWPLRPVHMPVSTCNAPDGPAEGRGQTRAPPVPFPIVALTSSSHRLSWPHTPAISQPAGRESGHWF